MPQPSHGTSELDARLAEIDRRLRTIQADLIPNREPSPPEDPPPAPPGRSGPLATLLARSRTRRRREPAGLERQADIAVLAQMHEGLLEAIRELVEAYGVTLRRLADAPAVHGEEVSLSVGPFAGTEAVHRFTQSLAAMELVRQVTILGYEGADRALLEVQLSELGA